MTLDGRPASIKHHNTPNAFEQTGRVIVDIYESVLPEPIPVCGRWSPGLGSLITE